MFTRRTGFAALLKELRLKKGLTQCELGKISGVPVTTIRQWEYGRREPCLGPLLRVTQGLGESLAVFDCLADPDPLTGARGQQGSACRSDSP